jgi:prepilin peptidase CpaA
MTFSLPPFGVNILLTALILTAAVYDLRFRRIPNWLTVSGVVGGIALNAFLYQGWEGISLSLGGLAVAFASYFLLYLIRAMGAGDVKLMAAIGAMVGLREWFGILLFTAVVGGIAGLALVTARGRLRKTFWNLGFILGEMRSGRPAYLGNEELDVRNPKSVGLPHGAVIAMGTIAFLSMGAHFTH